MRRTNEVLAKLKKLMAEDLPCDGCAMSLLAHVLGDVLYASNKNAGLNWRVDFTTVMASIFNRCLSLEAHDAHELAKAQHEAKAATKQ